MPAYREHLRSSAGAAEMGAVIVDGRRAKEGWNLKRTGPTPLPHSGAPRGRRIKPAVFGPLTGCDAEALLAGKTVPSKPFNDIHVLTDLATACRTPDQPGCSAVPFSCRMAELLGRVRPATRDIRLKTWIQTALRELPFGVLYCEAGPVVSYQPPSRFA